MAGDTEFGKVELDFERTVIAIDNSLQQNLSDRKQTGQRVNEAMRTLRLVIATTVDAPLEHVYAVLSDLPRYPKLFRYMHDLQILERRDHTVLAEVVEDMFGMKVMKVLTKFTFSPPFKLFIEQVKGPFAKAVAWFDLKPESDGKTRVVHGAEITVDGLLGAIGIMLLRSGKAKARMTEELKAVKREAEKLAKASRAAT